MRKNKETRLIAAVVAVSTLAVSRSRAQEVVAVLSSDAAVYRQAYESLQQAFGKAVPLLPVAGTVRLAKATKVVVAFGGKAAVKRYPNRVVLIYGIAPGLEVDRDSHDGKSIRIPMEPEAAALLSSLVKIQPTLKNLAILWSSDTFDASVRMLAAAGRAMPIAVDSEHLEDSADLPATLRRLHGRVDAIWMPADPLVINAENFETVRLYSYSNRIPLYVPTRGLAAGGATASVSVGYEEIGKTAAETAKRVLAGDAVSDDAYPQRSETSINMMAVKATAISIPPEVIRNADRVFP